MVQNKWVVKFKTKASVASENLNKVYRIQSNSTSNSIVYCGCRVEEKMGDTQYNIEEAQDVMSRINTIRQSLVSGRKEKRLLMQVCSAFNPPCRPMVHVRDPQEVTYLSQIT